MNKNTKIVLGITALLVFGGVGLSLKNSDSKKLAQVNEYCGSDGMLMSIMAIQSHRSYCIKQITSSQFAVNTPTAYSFSIVDDQGNTLRNFQIDHTKLLHFIVARKDLAYFQHLHPDFDPNTGIFTLKDLTFPADGSYRIFADFTPVGAQMGALGMPLSAVPFEDVSVGNSASYVAQSIGTVETSKSFDGLRVVIGAVSTPTSGVDTTVTFSLTQNRKPVTDLEPYLGALGHAVILREGNLDFIHAHPIGDVTAVQNGKISFIVNFPEAGKYKLFTQFQRAGKVITTDFVMNVVQGKTSSGDIMQGMNMSMSGMSH